MFFITSCGCAFFFLTRVEDKYISEPWWKIGEIHDLSVQNTSPWLSSCGGLGTSSPSLTQLWTFVMMMVMITIYTAWIHPYCNSMLIALERPQSSSWLFLSLMVHAGYVCVAIIHRPLALTTGSLLCAQILMHAITHRGVPTPKENMHWNLPLGRKSLAVAGNRTCISSMMVR